MCGVVFRLGGGGAAVCRADRRAGDARLLKLRLHPYAHDAGEDHRDGDDERPGSGDEIRHRRPEEQSEHDKLLPRR